MNKKFLLGAIATAMTCMSMVGCGINNGGTRNVQVAPGVTIEATGNSGAFTMEGDGNLGAITPEDIIGTIMPDVPVMDEQLTATMNIVTKYEAQPATVTAKRVVVATEETAEKAVAKDVVVLDNDECKVVFKGAEDAGVSEYSKDSKCYNVTYEITNKLDRDVVCFFNQEVLGAGETMTVTERFDTWYEKNSDIKAYSMFGRVDGDDNDKVILTRGFGEVSEAGEVNVAFKFAIPVNVKTLEFAAE